MDDADTNTNTHSDMDSETDTGETDTGETDTAMDTGDWTPPRPTGVPAVDAAVEKLSELDGLPPSEHVAVYDGVHRLLQDALADLDGI